MENSDLICADNSDICGSSCEIPDITNRYYERACAYRIGVCTETPKMMVNSTNNTCADITMKGEKLEEVTSFNYFVP
ncbi:hypothetical protein DPMN_149412 [Dreissena polymorpha]|uniref:Uncharacterized protein n=1 Tax=Dreissena polymorpha TaxID=45954 RepID=A0A9D4FBP8_DREPO|nr:hypothetical protein DPMN_149391 [Dreissena polymorpha]KAH3795850.1 hypothetical protein DPMN_149412 [Dreissena polymorpha]